MPAATGAVNSAGDLGTMGLTDNVKLQLVCLALNERFKQVIIKFWTLCAINNWLFGQVGRTDSWTKIQPGYRKDLKLVFGQNHTILRILTPLGSQPPVLCVVPLAASTRGLNWCLDDYFMV